MPRRTVKQDRSREEQLKMPVNNKYLGGRPPPCEGCRALAQF
jgi:hypothetical protein